MQEFLANNYIYFLIIAIFITFAAIGYFLEKDKVKHPENYSLPKSNKEKEVIKLSSNMTLGDALNKSTATKKNDEEVLIVDEPK